jgi:hypothetical protein
MHVVAWGGSVTDNHAEIIGRHFAVALTVQLPQPCSRPFWVELHKQTIKGTDQVQSEWNRQKGLFLMYKTIQIHSTYNNFFALEFLNAWSSKLINTIFR